jgi:alkylation response protein AidB-like acyl-CoA dehydrogenase
VSLAPTTEHDELRNSLRRFVDDHLGLAHSRAATDGAAFDRTTWRRLADDLGVIGLAVPDRFGGSGAGWQELAIVFDETGRTVVPEPLFATLGLALPVLLASDDESVGTYLQGIASGTTIAALAWTEPGRGWDRRPVVTTGRDDGDGWRIDGEKHLVLGGDVADLLLVTVSTDDGPSVVAVDADAPGVGRRPRRTLDGTRRAADITFTDAQATPIGTTGTGDTIIAEAFDVAAMLLANEMVGGAQACLDMSVAYGHQRRQFGRPIGSFQAVKHRCAEAFVAIEGARAAARYGAWAADHNPADLPVVSTVAKFAAGEVYFRAAADAIQIHGGIGFTWEHDAHLYFKRAKTSLMYFGESEHQLAHLADLLAI